MSIAIGLQVKCVAREIAMRERAYVKWIRDGKMKQATADAEIAAMKAVIETLKEVVDRQAADLWRKENPEAPTLACDVGTKERYRARIMAGESP